MHKDINRLPWWHVDHQGRNQLCRTGSHQTGCLKASIGQPGVMQLRQEKTLNGQAGSSVSMLHEDIHGPSCYNASQLSKSLLRGRWKSHSLDWLKASTASHVAMWLRQGKYPQSHLMPSSAGRESNPWGFVGPSKPGCQKISIMDVMKSDRKRYPQVNMGHEKPAFLKVFTV